MTDAVGPIFAAGFQDITSGGEVIVYLPDLHNDELQREGKAPVYWWLPNGVRLAQKENGDFKFNMIHFQGVRSESTHVGVEGTNEVAGGLVGFSTTAMPPAGVLEESEEKLLDRFRGDDDKYWGWRTDVAPMFRPVPIVSNNTSVTNLSPNADGTVPAPAGPTGGTSPAPVEGGATGGTSPAPVDGGATGGAPPGGPPRARSFNPSQPPPMLSSSNSRGRPPKLFATRRPPRFVSPQGSVPLSRGYRGSNLDMWYANLQGQGPGSVTPTAENAYSGLVGSLPAALIWASFHGGTSGITVWQYMKMKVWSPVVRIVLDGDWDKIQSHYSGAASGGGLFWSADIQAEFNNMRTSGDIEVKIEVDTTLPNADKIQEVMEKRSDLVFQKFMDAAQKTIFEPAPFTEEAAEASGGFLGFGGGVAFKLRKDQTHLNLHYEEKREMAYLQDYPISGQLEGLYDEIKANPEAEKKYFTTLFLDDWERKVSRVVSPVVNWPQPAEKWSGQPVAFVSAQIGYPDTQGVLQWDGHMFQPAEGPNAVWSTATSMKKLTDVANPPPDWEPDKTFVKRQVHFTEAGSSFDDPNFQVSIEKNVVDLDPGEFGTPLKDINLEVRVDNVGALEVGPIGLNVDLTDAKQIVEVTFQADGKTDEGHERPPVKFSWENVNQTEPRFWMVYTGQPDFIPKFKYQVRVIVKGTLFSKGMEWTGPWQETGANGPLMVTVPMQDDPGVTKKERPPTFTTTALPSSRPPRVLAGKKPRLAREFAREEPSEMWAGYTHVRSGSTSPPRETAPAGEAREEAVFEGFRPARNP